MKQFIFIFLLCFSLNGFSVMWQKVTEGNSGDIIYIGPNSVKTISIKTKGRSINNLSFEVLNGIIAPKTYLKVNIPLNR